MRPDSSLVDKVCSVSHPVCSEEIGALGNGGQTGLSYCTSCFMLEKAKTRDCVLPQFGRCRGVWWPILPTGGDPQPQVCSTNALPPSGHSLFGLRATLGTLNPGRTSGDQHSPKQKFRHSRQLAGHLCVIYLLTCGW